MTTLFQRAALALIAVFYAGALHAQTSAVTSAVYAQIFRTQAATGRSLIFSDVRGIGVTNHVFEWTVSGTPASCTLLIESSLDAVTWSTASTQTCTSNGSITLTDSTYSFLTANLSVLSGGSSPSVNVIYRGYLAGQGLPVRNAEGGTGTSTAFTAGSIVFAGASGVYSQNNSKLFWDNSSNRLCLLTATCTNTLDVNGAKFYVTSAGLLGSYEATARATSAGVVPLTAQGAAAQTANLQEWKSSAGTVLASVSSAGAITGFNLTTQASAAAIVPATVQGYAAQSANLQDWKNSAGSVLASVSSGGVVTPTSGMSFTGRSKYSTVPIGSVAYGSFGTDTTPVAGTIYWAELFIPRNITLTGVGVLNGATVGTNKWIVALYDSDGGAVVANSALAGVTSSGANAFQEIAFTGTYAAIGPARYWIAFQSNGTTDTVRTVAASTFIDVLTDSDTGSFGTLTSLTPPTTFTADVGPIAYVY